MSNVVAFPSQAEREYQEYVRLVEIMNEDLTFENARAAAKQWRRFMEAYEPSCDQASVSSMQRERISP